MIAGVLFSPGHSMVLSSVTRKPVCHLRPDNELVDQKILTKSLRTPKYTFFHNVLNISGFITFLVYSLTTQLFGEDCQEDALLQTGMKRKQQPRRRGCNERWKSTDTLLKFWPFWQLLASRWHCVRTMTIMFQAAHCLQQTVAISL